MKFEIQQISEKLQFFQFFILELRRIPIQQKYMHVVIIQFTIEFSLTPQQCLCICKINAFFVFWKKEHNMHSLCVFVIGSIERTKMYGKKHLFKMPIFIRSYHLNSPFAIDIVVDERMLKLWISFIYSSLRLTCVWVKFVLYLPDTHFNSIDDNVSFVIL